ncbi:MAG: hypothetical protein OJI67_20015 [Prosthecobacter sp.]|nr:hypothetical protein [Prosthecobacter sp.]
MGCRPITTHAIPLNQWTSLEVDFRFNRLQIKTDNTVTAQTPTSGNILVTTNPILVGTEFYGNLDRLTFRARATASSFAIFSGLGAGDTVQLDANGEGSFTVTSNGAATTHTSIRIFAKVNPEAETEIAMVDHDLWDYTCDCVMAFIGGDPETGPGTIASIAGGFLVVGDVGSVAKNLWRMTGWSSVEPNYVELTLGGVGILTTFADLTGVGAALDAGVAAVKTLAIRIGTSPEAVKFLNVFVTQIKRAVTSGEKFGLAEANFIKKMANDAPVADAFKLFLYDDALAKAAIRATDKLGAKAEAFYQGVKRASSAHGAETAKKFVQTFDGLSDEALDAIKNAPASELDEALDGLAKIASKGISPEAVKLALNNTHLFGSQYKRAHLLSDLGELAAMPAIKGLDDAVAMLKTPTAQAKGFRYEVEGAAWLVRNDKEVVELTKRVSVVLETGANAVKTDIDVVVREGGSLVYYQFKRSSDAFRYGEAGLQGAQAWVKKALKDLGPDADYSKIKYAVPDEVGVPPRIQEWFNSLDPIIEVLRIPHMN